MPAPLVIVIIFSKHNLPLMPLSSFATQPHRVKRQQFQHTPHSPRLKLPMFHSTTNHPTNSMSLKLGRPLICSLSINSLSLKSSICQQALRCTAHTHAHHACPQSTSLAWTNPDPPRRHHLLSPSARRWVHLPLSLRLVFTYFVFFPCSSTHRACTHPFI